MEPFISLSTNSIQNFILARLAIAEKTCSEGAVIAGVPNRAELCNQCGHPNSAFI